MKNRHDLNRRRLMLSGAALAAASTSSRTLAAVPPEVTPATPSVNQVGYLPLSQKAFSLVVAKGSSLRSFEIIDENEKIVFTGKTSAPEDLRETTGDYVARGDFSSFGQPGRYRITVDGLSSFPFEIGANAYGSIVHDAARCFYLIRANSTIDDPVTGIKITAGHASEGHLLVDGQNRDLTGGWYNAGDFGKYTHMAAMSVSHMLRLYELRPEFGAMTLSIDPLYPNLPDLLQLARWGLEWLLKMQNADGGVLHKVDSQPALTWNFLPSDDPNPRKAMAASSIDAGVVSGVCAHAARIYETLDPAFAVRCGVAARRAWAWLAQHPNVMNSDAYYRDNDARQETLWAACEIAILDGQDLTGFELPDMGVVPYFWRSPQILGVVSLAMKGHVEAKAQILAGAKSIVDRVVQDPYGYSILRESYFWQSNEAAIDEAVVCLYADHLQPGMGFRDTAQNLFDYVLGRNALNHSFVTGYGANATVHPFHWIYNMRKIAMPGWVSGGANGLPGGADSLLKKVIESGTPPAKCYVDAGRAEGSYASNEGETSENAAFLFVAGILTSPSDT